MLIGNQVIQAHLGGLCDLLPSTPLCELLLPHQMHELLDLCESKGGHKHFFELLMNIFRLLSECFSLPQMP